MHLTLTELAEMTGGQLLQGDGGLTVSRISKDTRTIGDGDVYFALKGENFDGNRFASDAIIAGAGAVVLDSASVAGALSPDVRVILVKDGLEALQKLASEWRAKLRAQVVCITGSTGKTSTKDLTAAVLRSRFRTAQTDGNLNNHIGVPLSILAAEQEDEAVVWEIGMNHPGEIAPLAALAKPRIAIITNIGVTHIEYMGTREAIALEKGMLAEALPDDGTLILSADDDMSDSIAARTRAKVIRTGFSTGDVIAQNVRINTESTIFTAITPAGAAEVRIPVPGKHMVRNALMAIAAGLELGISLEDAVAGIYSARLTAGRLQQKQIHGVHVIDDTYNASPDSMEAALETMRQLPGAGRRIAVLGRMGELGSYAETGYQRVGTAAAAMADALVAVGEETLPMSQSARLGGLREIHETGTTDEAAEVLRRIAQPGDVVLVKGSRSARMEQIIRTFEN